MKAEWPKVKLGEVLREQDNSVPAAELTEVNLAGVYSFPRGLFKRGPMSPGETSYKSYNRLVTDDFVISTPKAWEGALALVTPEFDGWFLSPVFPTFRASCERLLPKYLEWYCKRQSVWGELQRKSRGIGARRESVHPEQFLPLEIPLPPLAEQRRVVARIEELATQIHKARTLRHQASEEAEQLMAGEERRIWPEAILDNATHLESLTTFLARGKQSEQGESDHFLIKTQHVQQDRYLSTFMRLASHVASKVKPEAIVQDGDVLIACSAAGCLGRVARYRSDGRTASTDTHVAVLRPNPKAVEPDYLYAYLRGAQGQHQLRSRERGDWQREKVGFRLTELNLSDLRRIPVPVPSLAEQRRIVAELDALQAEVDALKRLQAGTAAELDALLPAILDRAFKGEL